MPRAGRVVAFIGVMALAAGGTMWAQEAPKPEAPQSLADMVDASRLPRMAGAQELFASKLTTSFVVRESVAELRPWMPWCHGDYSVEESRSWIELQVPAFHRRDEFEFALGNAAVPAAFVPMKLP